MTNVHIRPVGNDGTHYDIELAAVPEQHAADMRVRSWKPGRPLSSTADTDDETQLYDVHHVGAAVTPRLVGKAHVFGPDPDLTLDLMAESVTLTVVGALAHNGRTLYPLTVADHTALAAFMAAFR